MTPAEFGDLTPAEFVPYIDARIEWQKEQIKMENERFGLIAATIINGNPYRKKGAKIYQPSDFFKPAQRTDPKLQPQTRESILERSWAALMGWCNRSKP